MDSEEGLQSGGGFAGSLHAGYFDYFLQLEENFFEVEYMVDYFDLFKDLGSLRFPVYFGEVLSEKNVVSSVEFLLLLTIPRISSGSQLGNQPSTIVGSNMPHGFLKESGSFFLHYEL